MTKEQLIAQGLTEAQADAVLSLHTSTIAGGFIPKHRFDEVNVELKSAKAQITERDTQITNLKKFEGDATALQATIKALEETNAAETKKYNDTLALEKKKNAIRIALLEDETGKPHDADMVMGLFDLESIKMDETTGKINTGFKEQADLIKKEKSFLFGSTTPPKDESKPPFGWTPAGNPPKDGDKGTPPNNSESFGKSLAQLKLGMMGVNATPPPAQ